jgi:quercetin dioxygenase-like cupin family protein
MAEPAIDEEELGGVATRVLFENDRIKVWEMLLEPGESSDLHRHTMDYMLYIMEGSVVDADLPNGKTIQFEVEPGKVYFIERGGVERAVNRSDTRFREILVELKDSAEA